MQGSHKSKTPGYQPCRAECQIKDKADGSNNPGRWTSLGGRFCNDVSIQFETPFMSGCLCVCVVRLVRQLFKINIYAHSDYILYLYLF